ncbi:Hint domain-containing protein [Paracoccus saliphilus]|uniref:Hint domain-containing protein n=2 Tax=Paracoccus saliphilus TaxID=405559 RepID=A0AA45W2X4_9RHOB|nr:Hint domain-containing protein [Paracoccus saliphilus]SIS71233.1 Hint domain-containing protein [Paracoccus saliphilus]
MSGNHFLLSMTEFNRFVEPNPSYPTEYSGFQFKANWESDTVEVTADAAGTESRLPYTNDPANPYNNTGEQDPHEYTDVPVYVDGEEHLARNIKYEDTGNQAPYYAAGGGTNYMFVTFEDGERVYIPGSWQFAIVRPASGGPEELLIEYNQEFMDNLATEMAIHGQPASLDAGYTSADGEFPLNGGNGALLASTIMDSDSGAPVPCFARGTLISTDRGAVAVEELREGDLILTGDNGLQPIRWIGSRRLSAAELRARPNIRPIRIREGALGKNTPSRDLLVSPQHRVLVRSKIAQRMFGTMEILVAAKHLVEIEGIEIAEDVHEVEYFHMLFDRHEVVFANAAETESLYTGPEALKSVGMAAREEIFTLFPELRNRDHAGQRPDSARPLSSGRTARQLAMRHLRQNQPLLIAG